MAQYILPGMNAPDDVRSSEDVKRWQKRVGIRADGVWGQQTQVAYQKFMDRGQTEAKQRAAAASQARKVAQMKLPAQNGPQNMILKKPLENINSMEEGILVQQLARQIEPMLIKAGYGQHQGYDAISGAAPFVAHTPAAWQGAANPTGQKGGKMQTFPEFLQDRLAEEIEPMLSKAGYFSGNSGAAGVAPIAAQAGGPMMFAQGAGVGFDMERPEMQHRPSAGLGVNGQARNDLFIRTSGGLSVNGIGAILSGTTQPRKNIVDEERDPNVASGGLAINGEKLKQQISEAVENAPPKITTQDKLGDIVYENTELQQKYDAALDSYFAMCKEYGYDIITIEGKSCDPLFWLNNQKC